MKDTRYLRLLAQKYPTAEEVEMRIIALRALCGMPKGTEYFFSDLHGEHNLSREWQRTTKDIYYCEMLEAVLDTGAGKRLSRHYAYNAYYKYSVMEDYAKKILMGFDLDSQKSHIVNGHVPVEVKKGESPVKANGRLFIIDGGISKTYHEKTGIAGYTLIFNSHHLALAEHKPFQQGKEGTLKITHHR